MSSFGVDVASAIFFCETNLFNQNDYMSDNPIKKRFNVFDTKYPLITITNINVIMVLKGIIQYTYDIYILYIQIDRTNMTAMSSINPSADSI